MRQIGIDVDVHRVIELARISFDESENDILRRLLLTLKARRRAATSHRARPDPASPVIRSRGLWSVELKGERTPAANMKDAYRLLLIRLDDLVPGFLDRFAEERGRSRRFVARKVAELYPASPHLARDHAQHLKDDWYFDTNLSADQVAARARIAARIAGLRYGADVRLSDNLKSV